MKTDVTKKGRARFLCGWPDTKENRRKLCACGGFVSLTV